MFRVARLALLSIGLLLLAGCKSDDAFVIGGGPKPGFNNSKAEDSVGKPFDQHSNTSATTSAETANLIEDLAEPVLYVAGDSLLLLGGTVSDTASTLSTTLNRTFTGAGTTVSILGEQVQQSVDSSVIDAENGLIGALGTGDGNSFLPAVTGTVNGLATDLTGNGTLMGGVTDTVGSAADKLAGSNGLLGGATDTVESVAADLTGNTDGSSNDLLNSLLYQ